MSEYKGLYYVGVKPPHYTHVDIFQCRDVPSQSTHGHVYAFCYGGYKLKRQAIEVAMYHNYYIDTPQPKHL